MLFKKKCLVGLALLPIAINVNASPVVFYDSLTSSSSTGDNLVSSSDFGPLADSFSTGSSPYALTLTDLKLSLESTNPSSTGSVTVFLLGDSYGSPGATLATLGTVSDSSLSLYTPAVVDFLQSTPVNLAANSRYWIEALGTADSSAGWSYTTNTTGSGVASEFNANSFAAYSNSAYFAPYQLQVNGTVPEPATVWLIAAAACALRTLSLRKNSSTVNYA